MRESAVITPIQGHRYVNERRVVTPDQESIYATISERFPKIILLRDAATRELRMRVVVIRCRPACPAQEGGSLSYSAC